MSHRGMNGAMGYAGNDNPVTMKLIDILNGLSISCGYSYSYETQMPEHLLKLQEAISSVRKFTEQTMNIKTEKTEYVDKAILPCPKCKSANVGYSGGGWCAEVRPPFNESRGLKCLECNYTFEVYGNFKDGFDFRWKYLVEMARERHQHP